MGQEDVVMPKCDIVDSELLRSSTVGWTVVGVFPNAEQVVKCDKRKIADGLVLFCPKCCALEVEVAWDDQWDG